MSTMLVSAGLSWSLLVSAAFAVLCWFCAGLSWSLPVSLFCAGFVLVPQKTLQLFSRHFVGIAKRYIHIAMSWMFVHYPSVDELARPSTTPSVGELNQQNACTAEDANSTLSGRCEPSGGRSRAISRRRLGFAHTKIAPVAQRLPSGRVMVPAWGAVAQGSARGLGALYVGAALSLLGRLGKYFCTMAFATFAFAALGKLLDKFCRAFAPLLS